MCIGSSLGSSEQIPKGSLSSHSSIFIVWEVVLGSGMRLVKSVTDTILKYNYYHIDNGNWYYIVKEKGQLILPF
jgi:hypothetical protein